MILIGWELYLKIINRFTLILEYILEYLNVV
jgi:hypothetical protein